MDIRQEIPIKSFAIAAYICKLENRICKHLIIRRRAGQLGATWQMVSQIRPSLEKWSLFINPSGDYYRAYDRYSGQAAQELGSQ
jgi:hypothetical protein